MLFSLHIRCVALIKELDIDLSEGLTVFTGETGAGKSIIIDSIALLCGARSDKSIIRTGEDSAEVEGVFGMLSSDVLKALETEEVYPDEEGNLFLTRRITADGRSVSRINGRVVPVGKLRAVSAYLLDIHGQQDTTRLADESIHPALLDLYADNKGEKEEYSAAYRDYTALRKEKQALLEDMENTEEKKDFLSYRLKELRRAKLKAGEEEELTAKRNLLLNREKIVVSARNAYYALYEKDESAASLIAQAENALSTLSDYVSEAKELSERLESVRLEIEDIADTVVSYSDDPDGDPQSALDDIESRLSLIASLRRKYRTDEEGLIALLEETEKELNGIENSVFRKEDIEKELIKAEKTALSLGEKLYATRARAAKEMEKQIKDILSALDMPGVTFVTEFEKTPLSPWGTEKARFLISANAGEEPRPVAKIASGGECARIMLAVKSVLANAENIGTMIFDEVDTGISGATSSRIGMRLKALAGETKQVICVTHSAQIAALAKNHLLISKSASFGRTETHVRPLSGEARVKEVARIMGGIDPGEEIINAARTMIKNP
ncbi:MAG: DNA repair protein RecN [Clostridia bacterium]|nr:DNA repair protein RecN [Clostridia bacterium]